MPLYNPPQAPLSVTTKGDIQTFSTTPARLPVGSDGYYPIADSSQTTGLKYKAPDGWNEAFETWEYVSVDDPTGIFRVNADVTGKYSAGMRIKMTNGGNVICGIITVVGAYTGGYTSITFLHQIDPTDSLALYLMANSAITLNYYSTQKAPFGFPLSPSSWTVYKTDTTQRRQSSPSKNVWYNLGSISISIPIGLWNVNYFVYTIVQNTSATTDHSLSTTLSTANNSESSSSWTIIDSWRMGSAAQFKYTNATRSGVLALTDKTPYYLNTKTVDTETLIGNDNDILPLSIKAVCAYL